MQAEEGETPGGPCGMRAEKGETPGGPCGTRAEEGETPRGPCGTRSEEGELPREDRVGRGQRKERPPEDRVGHSRGRRDPRRTVWDTAEEGENPGGPPEESLSAHHPSVCWQEHCPQIWRVRGIGSTHVPHSSFAWIRLCVQGPTPMPEGPMQAARVTVETRRH